ncbi:hypothetical protein [Nonomuraea composti]|nr:hypothetical protein [Nonomuraea sp. FMUSA5-5]
MGRGLPHAPLHPYPAALDDAVAEDRELLAEQRRFLDEHAGR